MKKIFFSLTTSTLLFVAGCSKDRGLPYGTHDVNSGIRALTDANDKETRQLIYSQLSPETRLHFWKQHFAIWLDSGSIQANPQKFASVKKLNDLLNSDVFSETSEKKQVFLNYSLPKWNEDAKQIFSDEELYELTMENDLLQQVSEFSDETGETAGCFCHVGNTGYSCKRPKIQIYPPVFGVEYGTCESGPACTYSSIGCGALWLESCNGSHCSY